MASTGAPEGGGVESEPSQSGQPIESGEAPQSGGSGEAEGAAGLFLGVLKDRNLRNAELSYGLSIVAATAWIALLLVLTFKVAGPVGPGIFVLVRTGVGALASPAAAALAERWRRERVLALGFVIRAVAAVAVIGVLHNHMAVGALYVLAAVEGFGASAPSAIQYALLPWLASAPSQLIAANALSSLQEVSGIMVGGALDVVLLHLSGNDSVLIALVIISVVGAAMLASIRGVTTSLPPGAGTRRPSARRQLVAGVAHLTKERGPRDIVLALSLPFLLTGIAQSFASSVAIKLLHLGPTGTPLLIGCVGLGGLIGGVASVSLASRANLVPYLVGGLALSAIGPLIVAGVPNLAVTIIVLVVFGSGIALQTVATHSLLQRIVPTRVLGPVVGVTGFLAFGAIGCGAIVAAGLNSWLGIRATLLVTGLAAAAAAATVFIAMRNVESEDLSTESEREVISHASLFQLLSVAVKSNLAREIRPRDVEPGETLIAEGEPGNEFYIVEHGIYDVSANGKALRTHGAGDSFGEIALLFDSPRTATVRSREAGRVWVLEREAFLAALTGDTATYQLAQATASRRQARGASQSPPAAG